ncbi:MAG: ATP-binding protein [Candidatus Bathyarchaeia archaeon]|jgi:DNA-binding IscR family transcriptional regulator
MRNPFKYGTIVTGEDFADREKELKLLSKELTSGQHVLMYSPRRYGKSSLMIMVLQELKKKGIMTTFIDLYGCIFLSDLVDKIVKETVVPAYDKMDKIVNFLKSSLTGLRPVITVNPSDGSFDISYKKEVASAGENKVLSEVLDAPEKLAIAKNKPLVVVFDEFQEIENFDGKDLENLMRTHFQHHKHVTYVFTGSKKHLMEQMFTDSKRPFFKFARLFPLGKIPKEEFKAFIEKKFENTKVLVTPSIVDAIMTFTDGHPFFTQQLCHEVWNIACEKGKAQKDDVSKAIESLTRIQSDLYIGMWDPLTLFQKKLLTGISMEDRKPAIFSASFIEKYELVSTSHVSRATGQLLKKGLVEKENGCYTLSDIFFKEWIRRNGASNHE